MSLLTNWGYTLTDVEELPPVLMPADFFLFSAGKYEGDSRVEGDIAAASSAIRDYVGWHLFPSAKCELNTVLNDRRISNNGCDVLIQLPAKYVSAVESVQIGEMDITAYTYEVNGILRLYDVNLAGKRRYTPVTIRYTAGLPNNLMDGVKELAAYMATHALASSNGITSEAVGGASVTYNAGWVNSARATALPSDNKEALAPYKLQGVF